MPDEAVLLSSLSSSLAGGGSGPDRLARLILVALEGFPPAWRNVVVPRRPAARWG